MRLSYIRYNVTNQFYLILIQLYLIYIFNDTFPIVTIFSIVVLLTKTIYIMKHSESC